MSGQMNSIKVGRAKRQQLIASVALIGPSGSGKTLGSLILGYGMMKEKYPEMTDYDLWGKIAVIDTEHKRSLVYEGMVYHNIKIGEFLFIELGVPYSVGRYDEAIRAAKEAGAEVVIIDSTSHAWESEGGLMEVQQGFGGRFQDWLKTNPIYRDFISLCTGEKYNIHTINTIRAKQEYAMEPDELGKNQVKKLGMKPVQRDSLEYEFQVVFNVDMESHARMSKDNSSLFRERPAFVIKPEDGATLFKWLEKGEDIIGKMEQERQDFITMIKGFIAEFGDEVKEAVARIENHKAINSKIDHMNLEFLEKTYGIALMKVKEIREREAAKEAEEAKKANELPVKEVN